MKFPKIILSAGLVLASMVPAWANSNEDIFSQAFDGMFEGNGWNDFNIDASVMDNPPPPVPLDGGLAVLLATGAAVGYRRVRASNASKK